MAGRLMVMASWLLVSNETKRHKSSVFARQQSIVFHVMSPWLCCRHIILLLSGEIIHDKVSQLTLTVVWNDPCCEALYVSNTVYSYSRAGSISEEFDELGYGSLTSTCVSCEDL